jgi:hypothetical protein
MHGAIQGYTGNGHVYPVFLAVPPHRFLSFLEGQSHFEGHSRDLHGHPYTL